ncbi:metalloregulator ArsR/SmtB family transcription factor [Actinocorallia populi]|uniref:metalloregulator ArsR/SmtB family transcription factor n=1 Tax=Actinocorallia populi TaxID=2079200 RepID=UPI000D08D910|nr:metalloregulator ArsR/SmtB family transcription factor [Actinocorallia populi]
MDEVMQAIADPVRREILMLLREGSLPAGVIAQRFAISRPAVSRHLRVLRQSGLVSDELVGRRRLYSLRTEPLAELTDWLADLSRPEGWAHRFDALETEVRRTVRERRAQAQTDGAEEERTA